MRKVYSKTAIPTHLQQYFKPAEYGLEESPAAYVETMRGLFAELRRVLADDGTLWLNIGDSYSAGGQGGNLGGGAHLDMVPKPTRIVGVPPKNLLGIPWRVALALQDDGWILRNAVVWHKANAMPESVTDRLSSRYEMVFMFSKSQRYWFDLDAIREAHSEKSVYQQDVARRRPHAPGKSGTAVVPGSRAQSGMAAGGRELNGSGRNPGDVWEIPTTPFRSAHFAVMPQALAARAIQAGCKPGGTVLDPFSGSGTTGLAAAKYGRRYVGIDMNEEYLKLSLDTRLQQPGLDFSETA